jgi:hypothetical protein
MTEQRLDLGKTLSEIAAEIASIHSFPEYEVEFEVEPSPAALIAGKASSSGAPAEPKDLLQRMAEAEATDYELLSAAAGAVLPFSSAIAERLAAEAASARKRSTWAQDHLDLLSMS